MADWLTRSPEEHIQYDVDVLFGPWPSHPTDMDLPTLKAHLSHHHIQNALAISTRGALFSDQAGNTETLAATDWPSGSSPSATSPPDQMRGSIAVSPRPGGPPSSSPSATSPADVIGRPGGAAGSAAGQGRRAVGSGSSPSATSRPDQVREALGGSGRVGDLPGSSPSATLSAGVGGGSGGGAGAGGGQGGGVQGVDPGTGLGVRLIPVGTVDLRDAVSAAEQLDGLVESGVRFLRLFTGAQGVQGETPAYRHVVGEGWLSCRMGIRGSSGRCWRGVGRR
jgi:hypothetical protein